MGIYSNKFLHEEYSSLPDWKYFVRNIDYFLQKKDYQDTPKVYEIRIPIAHSRGETDYLPSINDDEAKDLPCYQLYVTTQVGEYAYNMPKDTFIYFRLPKSRKLVPILVHPSRGAQFMRDTRKYVLRETDELDRRIVLGFCDNYRSHLVSDAHNYEVDDSKWLKDQAWYYYYKRHAKRFKRKVSLEISIFSDVEFI